jgi:hypothetical protein
MVRAKVSSQQDRGSATERPRILFIAGYLRSGSTLLERLLGQVDGIVALGEVRYVWTNGFTMNQPCGCGVPFRSCPFWTEVTARAFGGFDGVDAKRMVDLQTSLDRLWRVPEAMVPFGLQRQRRNLGEYRRALQQLLLAAHKVSGSRVLVDSSKAPSHGFLLQSIPLLDVDIVHLIRDSRGVAHSWGRLKRLPGVTGERTYMPRYGPARAALEWDVMNVASHALRLGSGRYLRMRYEDLAQDPGREISRVLTAMGEAGGPLSFLERGTASLGVDHTVSGNPMRFQTGQIAVEPDLAWQHEMVASHRGLITALTWPLLRAYGYGRSLATAMRPKSTNGHSADSRR